MTPQIEIIGGVRAIVDGRPIKLRRQIQRLVAILVAAGPHGIEGSALAEELWNANPPPRWNAALRNAVTSLRSEVGPELVQTSSGRYSLTSDVEDVDAWSVLAAATGPIDDHKALDGVGRFHPFDGLEITPLLREMTDALHAARLRLIESVSLERPASPASVASLVAAVRADPLAEATAAAVVSMLVRLDRRAEAMALLDDIDAAYSNELATSPPPSILQARLNATAPHREVSARASSQEIHLLPSIISELAQQPLTVGRRDLAAQLAAHITNQRGARRISLIGVGGGGKSRFVAEVGRHLHNGGTNVVFATAIGDESSPYSAFMTARPDFRRRYLELTAATETAVWALWSAIVEDLGAQNRPVVLIVDDAHLLDAPSIRLLQFMHRMQPSVPITTIIAGRPGADGTGWPAFELELLHDDRTDSIDVEPLTVDEVALIIKRRWPRASDLVIRDAAQEVQAASAGLPMVAILLVESLTGSALRLPPLRQSHHVDMAADRLRRLEPAMQETLAAASLLGVAFSADSLAELLGKDPDDIEAILDRSERAFIVSNVGAPGIYRFIHDLLRQGAAGLASRQVRAEWSLALLANSDDAIDTARLAIAAKGHLDPDAIARAVVAGARAALDRNLIRTCVELAQAAREFSPGSDHEALACLAVGQVQLGAFDEAASNRAELIEMTTTPAEHARATQALLDSNSYVEVDNPTAIRVEDFDRLSDVDLAHGLHLERAHCVARLATWEGDKERRDIELERARSMHRTPDEEGAVCYAEWVCEGEEIDDAWFRRVGELRGRIGDTETTARLVHLECIELAARAQWAAAEASTAELRRLGIALSSAELQWHSKLLASGLAFAQGDIPKAEQLADDAFQYGLLYAIPLAAAARAAQAFNAALTQGTIASWLEFVESASPDMHRATLAIAGISRARFEVGRVDEAWGKVEPLLPSVLTGERRIAVSIVGMLAPLIRKRASPGLRQRCVDVLATAGDRWVITGSAIGVQGPATRPLAILEGDRRRLQSLRHQLAGQPMWTEVIDQDIARLDRSL